MKLSLTRRYDFAASHRLHCRIDRAKKISRIYGKCNNPYGHGHNYVAGSNRLRPGRSGYGNDRQSRRSRSLRASAKCWTAFDQKYLNEEVAEFRNTVPTTENLCREIFRRLQSFPNARLERVRIEETSKNSFEYRTQKSSHEEQSNMSEYSRNHSSRSPARENIADQVRKMFVQLGEDPDREGLRRTPERFEKALRFLTSGYRQDPDKFLNGAMFSVCYDEMVVVKDIELYSLCEHHLLPFFGKCHVAYIPKKRSWGSAKSRGW